MNIPYKTKSGVKIGVYYQKPKYIEEDMDMLRQYRDWETDRKSTRLNSSHSAKSRMPSSA